MNADKYKTVFIEDEHAENAEASETYLYHLPATGEDVCMGRMAFPGDYLQSHWERIKVCREKYLAEWENKVKTNNWSLLIHFNNLFTAFLRQETITA